MTCFKKALLGATALTAIAGMAAAQSNEATTSQTGNDNSLRVEQTHGGSATANNIAGNGIAGTGAEAIVQDGNDNDIDIMQHNTGGRDNLVGQGGDRATGSAKGVDQTGNNNRLVIDQSGSGLKVHDVQQKGGGAAPANNAEIDQTGSLNYVSNIDQDYKGSGAGNDISVMQTGSLNIVGNTGSGPRGAGIHQEGNGNAADIDQTGRRNGLFLLDQKGRGGGGTSNSFELTQTSNFSGTGNRVSSVIQTNTGAAPNTATITQNGQQNGTTGFAGAGAVAGLGASTVLQEGQGNALVYDAIGTSNAFAFAQEGRDNDIDAISNGVANEVAIAQDGRDNVALANQMGDENAIGARMTGNGNMLDMLQNGGGAGMGNAISVTIDGNNNNNFAVTGLALSDDALDARDLARGQGGMFAGLVQGDLFQDGASNSMTLNVTGDSNAFAMAQSGDGNTISGTFTHGSMNQAVVAQVSNGNSATFTIGGVGNNTGIMQGN